LKSLRSLIVLVTLFLSSLGAISAEALPNGNIISTEKFHPAAYSEIRGIKRYATEDEYNRATTDKRFEISKITYSSDGLPVIGYLYGPTDGTGPKLPVIVFNRGSYVVNGEIGLYLASFWRLANDGFLVFAPMYRGSDGAMGHDEMGGADVHDLLNAIESLRAIKHADASNVFLYGESRGGMMVFAGIRDGASVRAAATVGTITNLEAFFVEQPQTESQMSMAIWPNYKQDRAAILEHRSAALWPERVDVPVLLMHGGQDESVSPMHSLRMAEALQERQKEYALIIFAEDNHVLSVHREERDAQALKWFRAHLSDAGSRGK
jgi:dipeptidyl aminopeptidase/acylaminoacyl peptidase